MTLRIDISDKRERVIFSLTGRMQAEHVLELQTLVHSEHPEHDLVLDLTEVKLVDRDAVRFLAQNRDTGRKAQKLLGIYSTVDFARAQRDATRESRASAKDAAVMCGYPGSSAFMTATAE